MPCRVACADQQVAAAAARQAPGPDRSRRPGPDAVRRPDRAAGRAHRRLPARRRRAQRARLVARPRLHRGRDADPPDHPRRRQRASVRDPHQRLRHGPLPAHRHRAAPQAAAGRWDGEGLRARSPVPQRGRGLQAQPGVHLARGLRDLRRLRHDAGADPGDHPGGSRRHLRRAGRPAYRRRREDRRVRLLRRLAGEDHLRGGLRGTRRGGHRRHSAARAAAPRRADRARARPRPVVGLRARGDLRRALRGADHDAGLLHRLPEGERPAHPTPPHTTRGSPRSGTW